MYLRQIQKGEKKSVTINLHHFSQSFLTTLLTTQMVSFTLGTPSFLPINGYIPPSVFKLFYALCLQKQNLNMSVLKQKLDKASEEFQTHQFKEALASYEDCIAFCHRTREAQSLIFNIMTTKAALHQILGELDKAMNTLNEILRVDPNHYLALIRRSQVYKKKKKFNRGLKDLDMVSTFCPDNLQVTAMKIEIETMRSKNKNYNSSSEESESQDEYNEQMQLNFSNLKKIDRKSCSIVVNPVTSKARQSRVTISGDTAVQYESAEVYDKSNNSTSVSKEQAKELYQKTFKEIEMDKDEPTPASNIVAKSNTRSKSILKNKNTLSILNPSVQEVTQEQKYGGRESRFVEKIKDIDGKMISSQRSIGSEKGKEVEFRKSKFASQEKQFMEVQVVPKKEVKKAGGSRKSCLKRSSFQQMEEEIKERPVRKSKFETMGRGSIDGAVIKNRNSIHLLKPEIEKVKNNEDSDEDSSHNIFGSQQNVALSKEVKEKLGLREPKKEEKTPGKGRAGGGKSILKKGSVLISSSENKTKSVEELPAEEEVPKKMKAKKSVMFTKSRFAQ